MDTVVSTLFLPVGQSLIEAFEPGSSIAFLNAYPHPALHILADEIFVQQNFKPYAALLQDAGYVVVPEIMQEMENCAAAFVLLPKNMIEARMLIAKALKILGPEGLICCAADNKAGGNRLKKMLQQFGLDNVQDLSKNKARVAWALRSNINENTVNKAIEDGAAQNILEEQYISMPGIFGWDKVDKGSEILLQNLPYTLKGRGADFGCGYGFLSKNIVQSCKNITELLCVDADARAVKLCEKNLEDVQTQTQFHFLWEDLTAPLSVQDTLDFIVMNPPFHEGKKTDDTIGKSFIKTAAHSLRQGGELWMVANVSLPYERTLHNYFKIVHCLFEGQGFKVFYAKK